MPKLHCLLSYCWNSNCLFVEYMFCLFNYYSFKLETMCYLYHQKIKRLKPKKKAVCSLNHCYSLLPATITIIWFLCVLLLFLFSFNIEYVHAGKGSRVSTDYNRSDWIHWTDEDKDGLNTRNEVLVRDNTGLLRYSTIEGSLQGKFSKRLKHRKTETSTLSGTWVCPYTHKIFYKASELDIDHIVPLSNAYRSGGNTWSKEKKKEFANDQENLLCVEDNVNRQKGDKSPDQWKPPVKEYWSTYALLWIKIKTKYNLSYTKEETIALQEMIRR